MKRLLFATVSLCIAAAAASPVAAFAAQPAPAYPDIYGANLEFTTLKDFAIGDNCAAYTDGNTKTRRSTPFREKHSPPSTARTANFTIP